MHQAPVALITGSSRGIGRAIASALAADRYAVCINYLNNREAAESLADEITADGGTATICGADVGSAADRDKLISHAYDTYGRLDVLVNNAGITSQGRMDLLELTDESWERVFATNLKGPFFLAQQVAPSHDRQHIIDFVLRHFQQPSGLLHRQVRNTDDDMAAGRPAGFRKYLGL